jgi:hypothetical protein
MNFETRTPKKKPCRFWGVVKVEWWKIVCRVTVLDMTRLDLECESCLGSDSFAYVIQEGRGRISLS